LRGPVSPHPPQRGRRRPGAGHLHRRRSRSPARTCCSPSISAGQLSNAGPGSPTPQRGSCSLTATRRRACDPSRSARDRLCLHSAVQRARAIGSQVLACSKTNLLIRASHRPGRRIDHGELASEDQHQLHRPGHLRAPKWLGHLAVRSLAEHPIRAVNEAAPGQDIRGAGGSRSQEPTARRHATDAPKRLIWSRTDPRLRATAICAGSALGSFWLGDNGHAELWAEVRMAFTEMLLMGGRLSP
jgi:hypothetical protein